MKFLLKEEVGADPYIQSHLSGRDAMQISLDAHYDRITDILNSYDYKMKKKIAEEASQQEKVWIIISK